MNKSLFKFAIYLFYCLLIASIIFNVLYLLNYINIYRFVQFLHIETKFVSYILYNITIKSSLVALWLITVLFAVVYFISKSYNKQNLDIYTLLKNSEKYDKLTGYLVTDPWGKVIWLGNVFKHIFKVNDTNILNILNNSTEFFITNNELAVINNSFKNSSSGYLDIAFKVPSLDNNFRLLYTRINNIYIWQIALIKSQNYLQNAFFMASNLQNLNFAFVSVEKTSGNVIYYNEKFKVLFNLSTNNYNEHINTIITDNLEDNLDYKELYLDNSINNFTGWVVRNLVNISNKEYYNYIVIDNANIFANNNVFSKSFENAPLGMLVLNKLNVVTYINKWLLDMFAINDTNNLTIPLMLNNTAIYFNLDDLLNKKVLDVECNINKERRFFKFILFKHDDSKICYILDTTNIKNLESQIKLSEGLQTVGQIASAVAHDFNNLLTAIMSFTYFAQEKRDENDPSMAELEQIKVNANRAKVMIKQLLTFSRKQDLQPVEFDVNSEISDLMSTIIRLMGEKVKASFIRGNDVGSIFMDKVQFQQIITNLVINAKDAMKIGGNLHVISYNKLLNEPYNTNLNTIIPPDNYVIIEVKDEGEGIKPEYLQLIFNAHFSTKGDKGNGLGLSTVSKIVSDNAGFIDVKTKLDIGTSFYIYLPKIQSSNLVSNKPAGLLDNVLNYNANAEDVFANNIPVTLQNKTKSTNSAQSVIKGSNNLINKKTKDIPKENNLLNINNDFTGNETILLVEDELPVRMVCARHLRNKGYNVLEAVDGIDAIEKIKNGSIQHIDLIISDVMMPNIGGPELISQVRDLLGNIKAMLISGYTEDVLQDINKDTSLKDIVFLAKPFLPDTLASKVKQILQNK